MPAPSALWLARIQQRTESSHNEIEIESAIFPDMHIYKYDSPQSQCLAKGVRLRIAEHKLITVNCLKITK